MGQEHHHVSADFMNITATVHEFFRPVLNLDHVDELSNIEKNLTHISRKGTESGFHLSRRRGSTKEHAFFYIRAICRIYLVDYTCAGYELPLVCADLHAEVKAIVKQHSHVRGKKLHWAWDYVLPRSVKSVVGSLRCFRSRSPECYWDFMNNLTPGFVMFTFLFMRRFCTKAQCKFNPNTIMTSGGREIENEMDEDDDFFESRKSIVGEI